MRNIILFVINIFYYGLIEFYPNVELCIYSQILDVPFFVTREIKYSFYQNS